MKGRMVDSTVLGCHRYAINVVQARAVSVGEWDRTNQTRVLLIAVMRIDS